MRILLAVVLVLAAILFAVVALVTQPFVRAQAPRAADRAGGLHPRGATHLPRPGDGERGPCRVAPPGGDEGEGDDRPGDDRHLRRPAGQPGIPDRAPEAALSVEGRLHRGG